MSKSSPSGQPNSPGPVSTSPGEAVPLEVVLARWPAPPAVRALSTTRKGGTSTGAWSSLNLGFGSGDDPAQVVRNRERLRDFLDLRAEPLWLEQVHGTRVVFAEDFSLGSKTPQADACIAKSGDRPCVALSADCLPVVLCDTKASRVGIAHAGWRGLAQGVIPACIEAMQRPPEDLLAWLGPAIGPDAYEVGEEVREALATGDKSLDDAFRPGAAGKWQANLFAIAKHQIKSAGVHRVYGDDLCTFADPGRFFSHRRDRGITGRIATLVWLAPAEG